MFRRCASLLVITGLLASQWAAVPHAHAAASAQEQEQHDATPHFHCKWLSHAEHEHGHSHGRDGHSHHDDVPKSSHTGDSAGNACSPHVRADDHGADAVYLAHSAGSVLTISQSSASVAAWRIAALAPLLFNSADVEPTSLCAPPWHPPDAVLDASHTYLTLRNLRI